MSKPKTQKEGKPELASARLQVKKKKVGEKVESASGSGYFGCHSSFNSHLEFMKKFESIEEVVFMSGVYHYMIRLNDQRIGFVNGKVLRETHPQELIRFFESRMVFEKTGNSQEKKYDEAFEAYSRHLNFVDMGQKRKASLKKEDEDEADEENDKFGLPNVREIMYFEDSPETSESSSEDEIMMVLE